MYIRILQGAAFTEFLQTLAQTDKQFNLHSVLNFNSGMVQCSRYSKWWKKNLSQSYLSSPLCAHVEGMCPWRAKPSFAQRRQTAERLLAAN